MQQIVRKVKNIHPIFDDIERLYAYTSERKYVSNTLIKPKFDLCFSDILDLFYQYSDADYDIELTDKHYSKLKLPKYNSKNMIILLSGGKDSISTLLHYKSMGYNLYLYHLRGYNRVAPDEYKQVQKIADYLNLPLQIDEIKWKGKHDWGLTHPLKSFILYNEALNYGIKNNIGTKIACGDFLTSSLEQDDLFEDGFDRFNSIAGDTAELLYAYEEIIQTIIPNFKIFRANKNYHTSFRKLQQEPKLLELSMSCVNPQRFRERLRTQAMNKYKVNLLEHRCGYCWKCSSEYIYYTDHGLFEYNEQYYIQCLNNLAKALFTEYNINLNTVNDLQKLWDNYFFYPMTKSKWKNIFNAKLVRGKIVI